jgi:hypothetical protein
MLSDDEDGGSIPGSNGLDAGPQRNVDILVLDGPGGGGSVMSGEEYADDFDA